jgi:hypothetical protein
MLCDFQTSTTPQYSDKLRKLISKWMAISQDDRPTVQEVLASTQTKSRYMEGQREKGDTSPATG